MRLQTTLAAVVLLAACALPSAAAPTRLPPYTKTTLKNGLTVFIMPTHRLPLVDLRLVVRAGAVSDPAGKEGLASLTADLLTQGAGARNAQQIADDIAFVGGDLGAGASAEQTIVTCEVLKKDFATGLEMFRDVIVSPTFPAEELERKKSEALGAIAANKDDPGTVADTQLLPFMMGKSALGHPAIGWEASVRGLTRDDVVAFHRDQVVPDNAILAIVGDVQPKETLKAIEAAFKDWKKSGRKRGEVYPPLTRAAGRKIAIVSKPEVTQTQIRFACVAVPRNHPDYFPIVAANTILGAGFTSRLIDEIRVNKGLTYSISSQFAMYQNAGLFRINTFTRNETIHETIDETIKVVEKLREDGPTPEELQKSKAFLTGLYPLGLQAPDNLAARLIDVEFYGLAPDYIETYADRINAVTMEDVRRVLKSYFCTKDLSILVVSNPDIARPALESFGKVEDVAMH
jgi:zinc protease